MSLPGRLSFIARSFNQFKASCMHFIDIVEFGTWFCLPCMIEEVGGGPGPSLLVSGFDTRKRTLFLMEGLTPYLEAPAIEEILAFVRTCAPGSLLASTWINNEMFQDSLKDIVAARQSFADMGESFRFALPSRAEETEEWVKVRVR